MPRPGSGGPVAGDGLGRSLERALSQAVRTPLHSVLGFLELLAMSGLDGEQRRLHEQLVDAAEDLLSGSDRVLWLVRLLGGHYAPRPARVHLAAFVAEVAAAGETAVTTVVAPDAPPHLETDLAALHQLVTELLTNATVHGAAPVVLSVTPAGPGSVCLAVSDGGAGSSAGAREALASHVAGLAPSAGVGLLLVRRLSALLGGTVGVVRTPVGARVALTLPVIGGAGATAPPGDASAAPTVLAEARPLRVLLVEDNATNRLLTQRQLARLGHSLVAVPSGEAGVRAALEQEVDVVLMDRHLPDLDGCEATRLIRAGLPVGRAYLPVIGVTADATAEAREACTAAGMDEVLTKPVDLEHLGAALARATTAVDQDAGADRRAGAAAGASPPPGAAAPAAPAAPAALRALLQRMDGDAASTAEVVTTYLGELPGRRLRIQASLRRGEPRAVLAAAESLRTSSDSIGAAALSGACAALAGAAAADDLASARSFLPSLMLQCERIAGELAGFDDAARIREALGAPAL